MVRAQAKNVFYDINKLPLKEGMLVFPRSMRRIGTPGQDPATYWEQIQHFNPHNAHKINETAKMGGVFIYTDGLYLTSDEKAFDLKKKFIQQMNVHKNTLKKIVYGAPHFI